MNSIAISPLTLKMSGTASYGGMRSVPPSRAYPEWLWITSQFQVKCPSAPPVIDRYSLFLATSIDVERVFSQGRLLLSHVRSRLSVQSTRALLCVGTWSELGLIKDSDIKGCLGLDEVCEEEELAEDWDTIPAF